MIGLHQLSGATKENVFKELLADQMVMYMVPWAFKCLFTQQIKKECMKCSPKIKGFTVREVCTLQLIQYSTNI